MSKFGQANIVEATPNKRGDKVKVRLDATKDTGRGTVIVHKDIFDANRRGETHGGFHGASLKWEPEADRRRREQGTQ